MDKDTREHLTTLLKAQEEALMKGLGEIVNARCLAIESKLDLVSSKVDLLAKKLLAPGEIKQHFGGGGHGEGRPVAMAAAPAKR